MTTEECDKFMRLLNRKWPNRWDPDDLLEFATKLQGHPYELLEGIAAELKVSFTRPPTLKDFYDSIRDRENKPEDARPTARTIPPFDMVAHVREMNPHLKGVNAASVVLLYFRATWRRMLLSYKKRPDHERDAESRRLQSQCLMSLCAAGYDYGESSNAAAWISADYSIWVEFIAQTKAFDLLKDLTTEEVAA